MQIEFYRHAKKGSRINPRRLLGTSNDAAGVPQVDEMVVIGQTGYVVKERCWTLDESKSDLYSKLRANVYLQEETQI